MCFALLKIYKILIFNTAVAIETIVSVKKFLRSFSIALPKRSMFTFTIIKHVSNEVWFSLSQRRERHYKFNILIGTEL